MRTSKLYTVQLLLKSILCLFYTPEIQLLVLKCSTGEDLKLFYYDAQQTDRLPFPTGKIT